MLLEPKLCCAAGPGIGSMEALQHSQSTPGQKRQKFGQTATGLENSMDSAAQPTEIVDMGTANVSLAVSTGAGMSSAASQQLSAGIRSWSLDGEHSRIFQHTELSQGATSLIPSPANNGQVQFHEGLSMAEAVESAAVASVSHRHKLRKRATRRSFQEDAGQPSIRGSMSPGSQLEISPAGNLSHPVGVFPYQAVSSEGIELLERGSLPTIRKDGTEEAAQVTV